MYKVLVFASLFFCASSSIVPIETSSVDVQHSGPDYSYSIKEKHGIAIEPYQVPVLKISPGEVKEKHAPIIEHEIKPISVKSAQMTYAVPLLPAYPYLPTLPYPYINYPYNYLAAV